MAHAPVAFLHKRRLRATYPPTIALASEVCGNPNSWLPSVRELKASGFQHLSETIDGALPEFLAALKADNGFGRYLGGGGQFPGTQANSRSCHSAL